MTDVVAAKIAQVLAGREAEDSFFIFDPRALREQYDLWKTHLPEVTPHYAVKCNNHGEILARLVQWGAHFDCASANEIQLVEAAGGTPDRIVYANPVKAPTQLRYAAAQGVRRMTFDNLAELDKIKAIAPDSEVLLRIQTDDSAAICSLSCKFGASLLQTEDLLRRAQELGLKVVGVAYHVGSGGGTGPQAHHDALRDARQVFTTAQKFGHTLSVLDVGGGFEASAAEFVPVAAEIRRSLAALDFPAGTSVMGEPGRFFAATCMTLVANVTGVRAAPTPAEADMAYLSDGVYGNLNCIIYDHQHPKAFLVGEPAVEPAVEPNDGPNDQPNDGPADGLARASLWGPTCDGLDTIDSGARFPRRLRPGDWLYFPNTGAYTQVGESAFNGFNTNTQIYTA